MGEGPENRISDFICPRGGGRTERGVSENVSPVLLIALKCVNTV